MPANPLASMVALALLLAGLPGGADAAAPAGGDLPAVRTVSITATGIRSDGASGDESAEYCSRFQLRPRDVREFLAAAKQVNQRAYHHDLEMSRCNAEGRVTFANGQRGRWWIDQERRGRVVLTDGQPIYLYCSACTSRQFEPVYDPDRDSGLAGHPGPPPAPASPTGSPAR